MPTNVLATEAQASDQQQEKTASTQATSTSGTAEISSDTDSAVGGEPSQQTDSTEATDTVADSDIEGAIAPMSEDADEATAPTSEDEGGIMPMSTGEAIEGYIDNPGGGQTDFSLANSGATATIAYAAGGDGVSTQPNGKVVVNFPDTAANKVITIQLAPGLLWQQNGSQSPSLMEQLDKSKGTDGIGHTAPSPNNYLGYNFDGSNGRKAGTYTYYVDSSQTVVTIPFSISADDSFNLGDITDAMVVTATSDSGSLGETKLNVSIPDGLSKGPYWYREDYLTQGSTDPWVDYVAAGSTYPATSSLNKDQQRTLNTVRLDYTGGFSNKPNRLMEKMEVTLKVSDPTAIIKSTADGNGLGSDGNGAWTMTDQGGGTYLFTYVPSALGKTVEGQAPKSLIVPWSIDIPTGATEGSTISVEKSATAYYWTPDGVVTTAGFDKATDNFIIAPNREEVTAGWDTLQIENHENLSHPITTTVNLSSTENGGANGANGMNYLGHFFVNNRGAADSEDKTTTMKFDATKIGVEAVQLPLPKGNKVTTVNVKTVNHPEGIACPVDLTGSDAGSAYLSYEMLGLDRLDYITELSYDMGILPAATQLQANPQLKQLPYWGKVLDEVGATTTECSSIQLKSTNFDTTETKNSYKTAKEGGLWARSPDSISTDAGGTLHFTQSVIAWPDVNDNHSTENPIIYLRVEAKGFDGNPLSLENIKITNNPAKFVGVNPLGDRGDVDITSQCEITTFTDASGALVYKIDTKNIKDGSAGLYAGFVNEDGTLGTTGLTVTYDMPTRAVDPTQTFDYKNMFFVEDPDTATGGVVTLGGKGDPFNLDNNAHGMVFYSGSNKYTIAGKAAINAELSAKHEDETDEKYANWSEGSDPITVKFGKGDEFNLKMTMANSAGTKVTSPTTMYVPIPKADQDWGNMLHNKEPFEFSTSLVGPITQPAGDKMHVYYGIDVTPQNSSDRAVQFTNLEAMTFVTADQVTDWSKVNCVKLVADEMDANPAGKVDYYDFVATCVTDGDAQPGDVDTLRPIYQQNVTNNAHETYAGVYNGAFVSLQTINKIVQVEKVLDTTAAVAIGDEVQYTITVRNDTQEDMTDVKVVDTPTNITITSMKAAEGTTGVTVAADNLSFVVASLPAGGSASVVVKGTATATSFDNNAEAETDEPDAQYTLVKVRCDENGNKIDAFDGLQKGSTVHYKIVLTNTSNVDIPAGKTIRDTYKNITPTDPLPTGVTQFDNETLTWLAPTIPANDSVETPVLTFTTNTDDYSLITNTGSSTDGKTSTVTDVIPNADVSVSKTLVTTDPVKKGDTVTYKVSVTNNDEKTAATNVKIDENAAGLKDLKVTAPATASLKDGQIVITSIAAGATVDVTVTATVDTDTQFSNGVATTGGTDPQTDYKLTKVRCTADGTALAADTVVSEGDTVYYKVSVANTGKEEIENVDVVDTFTNLTFDKVVSGTGYEDGTWSTGKIAVKGTTNLVLAFTVNAGVKNITNAATTPKETVVVTDPVTDYTVTKKITSTTAKVGEVATYEITVKNNGNAAATNVVVPDSFTNLTFKDATGATYDAAKKTFTVDKIAAGATATITANYTIAAVPFTNAASKPQPGTDKSTITKTRITSATDTTPVVGTVNRGDTIYYQVTVTNTGTAEITNRDVVDTPGTGLTLTASDKGTIENGVLKWSTGKIAVGASVSAIVTATVGEAAKGSVSNAATDGPNTVVTTDPLTDVTVAKALTSTSTKVGEEATYDITVKNNGSVAAANIVIPDSFINLTYKSATGATYDAAKKTFTVDTIAAGATATIKAVYTIDAVPFTNAASAPQPGDEKSTITKTRIVSATDTTQATDPINPGDTIFYQVTVTNTGSEEIANRDVVDTPATGLTITAVDKGDIQNNGTVKWATGAIAKGASVSMIVTAKVGAVATMATNTATDGPNTVVVTEPVTNVSVTKKLTSTTSAVGEKATYDITVTNSGAADVTDYVVADTFTNLTYVSAENATYDAAKKTFTIDTVPANKSVVIKATYTIDALPFSNSASAPQPDGFKSTITKTRITSATDETPATDQVLPGSQIFYVVTVTNTGTEDIDNRDVVDTPAPGLTITAVDKGTIQQDGTVKWATGKIEVGKSQKMIVTAIVGASAGNTVTNTATDGPNTVVVTDPVVKVDVSKKLVSTTTKPGETATYEITVNNTSTVDVEDYAVVDTFKGLTFVNAENATYDEDDNTFTIEKLAAGATVVIKANYTIDEVPFSNSVSAPQPDAQKSTLEKVRVTDETGATEATEPIKAGDTIYYKLTVTNVGTTELAGRDVIDTPSTGLTLTASDKGTIENGVLKWSTGKIAVGASATAIVTATVAANAKGVVTNTATDGPDTVVVTDPVTDVSVAKKLVSTSAKVGDEATYEISVVNNGSTAVENYKVTDTFVGLEYKECMGADYADGVFTVAKLEIGETVTITAKYTITADPFTNNASGEQPENGKSTITKTRIVSPEDTTAVEGTVGLNQTIYYLVTVTNTGTADIANRDVVDTPSAGLTIKATDKGEIQADGTVKWATGAIAKGESVSMVVTATVGADAVDSVTNAATDGPNTVVTTDPLTTLAVTKRLMTNEATVGDKVTYEIAVTNTGDVTAINAEVADTFTGLKYVDSTVDAGAVAYADGKFTIDSIDKGATVTITANYTVESVPFTNSASAPQPGKDASTLTKVRVASATDTTPVVSTVNVGQEIYYLVTVTNTGSEDITNRDVVDTPSAGLTITATDKGEIQTDGTVKWATGAIAKGASASMVVTATVGKDAVNSVTNTATDGPNTVVTTNPLTSVSASKTLESTEGVIGGKATYKILVTNLGNAVAENIEVLDTAQGLTYEGVTADGCKVERTENGFKVDAIPAGESVVLHATYTIASIPFTNSVSAPSVNPAGTLTKIRVASATDMTPATNSINVGSVVFYQVMLKNSNEVALPSQTVTDMPNLGLTITGVSTASGEAELNEDGTATWTTDEIAAGESAYMLVTALVDGQSTDVVTNTATDGTTTVVVTEPLVKMSIVKTADVESAMVGNDINYTIKVSNEGGADAKDFVVTDTLGAGLKYKSDDASGKNNGQETTWVVTVPARGSVTIHLTATVADDAAQSVKNVATVTNPDGSDKGKNVSEVEVTVTNSPVVHPLEATKVASAKTGDNSLPFSMALGCIIAAGCVAYAARRRRGDSDC